MRRVDRRTNALQTDRPTNRRTEPGIEALGRTKNNSANLRIDRTFPITIYSGRVPVNMISIHGILEIFSSHAYLSCWHWFLR